MKAIATPINLHDLSKAITAWCETNSIEPMVTMTVTLQKELLAAGLIELPAPRSGKAPTVFGCRFKCSVGETKGEHFQLTADEGQPNHQLVWCL